MVNKGVISRRFPVKMHVKQAHGVLFGGSHVSHVWRKLISEKQTLWKRDIECGATSRNASVTVSTSSASVVDWTVPEVQVAAIVWRDGLAQSNLGYSRSWFEDEPSSSNKRTNEVHRLITEAPDVESLLQVAESKWEDFDTTATVRALAWLAKFSLSSRASEQSAKHLSKEKRLFQQNRLESLISSLSPKFTIQEVVVIIVAFAQLGWKPQASLLDRFFSLASMAHAVSELKSHEMTRLVWALGRMELGVPKEMLHNLESHCLKYVGQIDIHHMLHMLWGFSQLSYNVSDAWIKDIKSIHSPNLGNLRPSEQALLAWSLCRVGLSKEKTISKALLSQFQSSIRQYDLVSINLMLKCFHIMGLSLPTGLMQKCEVRCLNCLSKCETGPIVEFLYRCVKSKHRVHMHTKLYIENAILGKIEELNPKDLALLMWSFAKVGHVPKPRFQKRLEVFFTRCTQRSSPQSLSLLIWSYAKLKLNISKAFIEKHFHLVKSLESELNMQCLANILWSYGRLRAPVPAELLQSLTSHLVSNVEKCNAQNISNILISCARLNHKPGDYFLQKIEAVSLKRMKNFSCQGMSNLLWSFVKLNWRPSDSFMLAFQKHLEMNVERSSPQNIANIVWSFSQLHYSPYQSLLNALYDTAELTLKSYSEKDVATLLWGSGKLKYNIKGKLLEKLEKYCMQRSVNFSLHSLSLALWGFTQQLISPSRQCIELLLEKAIEQLDDGFHIEPFVHIMWSLSVMKINKGALLVTRYESQLNAQAKSLSGYDASKLFCSLAFLDCMPTLLCEKLMAVMRNRMHSYDASQLQSILNACEALDAETYLQSFHEDIQETLNHKGALI